MLQAYEYDAILRMCATYDGKVDKMMEVAMIAMHVFNMLDIQLCSI